MDISEEEISKIIGQPESEKLEYKAVLPPSRILAQIISAFANTLGGYIILGVREVSGKVVANGLSADFNANKVTNVAIELISPKPNVGHQYISYKGKSLYVIKIEHSSKPVSIEDKIYKRLGDSTIIQNPESQKFNVSGYSRVSALAKELDAYVKSSTGSKTKFLDHYKSVLKIIDDLKNILYPDTPNVPTTNPEGKVLTRILFSSCADNFETYLSELLYEIYLANPSTLKSDKTITIKEVLECADMQEFVVYYAKKRLSKLQRGSIKGFIIENDQINSLNVLNEIELNKIEAILQIRHLYSHRNGVVDEKFLKYYPTGFKLNDQHQLSIQDMLGHFTYLAEIVNKIDQASIKKYLLATLD